MGRKLTVYMLDGTATGPRIIEIGNWAGKAVFCSRSSLRTLLSRAEFLGPGIYMLQSQSDKDIYAGSIYFGEAEQLGVRLKQHLAERDFESIICFSSKDDLLTKAHIKYLEAKLIQLAKNAKTSNVENNKSPRGARLSEADISDMEYFIEQVGLILPLVGIRALIPAAPHTPASIIKTKNQLQYSIKPKNLSATMIESEEGYTVLAGSEAIAETSKSIALGWLNIRKKLMEAGVLQQVGKKLVFTQDALFSSPSAASSVVLGRQAPGPISWIHTDGRTYKDVQAEAYGS